MLQQTSTAITFLAFFVASKTGKASLTPTVDVYRDGTKIVSDGSATEIGGGLYSYALASGSTGTAGSYIAVFKTADATVDAQHIPSLWVVGATWVGRVDAAISDIPTAGEIWANATRTLTQSAASVAAVVSGSNIAVTRGDTWTIALTGLGNISARSKLYFTAKSNLSAADSTALVQVEETAGLLYANGASATTTDGTLVVSDASAGNLTVTIKPAATVNAVPQTISYDVQMVTAAGVVTTLTSGVFSVASDVTRVVS